MENSSHHIRGVIEALLFVNERPIALDQIRKVLSTVSAAEIKIVIQDLNVEYEEKQSGMTIMEIANGYQMLSNPSYASYVREFYKTRHKAKLSKPSLESLAIIAYKQPVTRTDIEMIRGVNSDGVVAHLVEKELIKPIGRKDVPGRPFLYGTTKIFLEYFGLKSLEDLPKLDEFPAMQSQEEAAAMLPLEEGEEESGEQPLAEPSQQSKEEDAASEAPQTQEAAAGDVDQQSEVKMQTSTIEKAEEFLKEAEERIRNDEPE